jgi:hypothetical protein
LVQYELYYVPNDRWKILMLNWKNGGSSLKGEMYKNLVAHKKDEDLYRTHLFTFKSFKKNYI